MRTIFSIPVLVAAVVLFLSLSAVAQEVGYIADMRGIVEVMRHDANKWKPAVGKSLLYLNDSIRTETQSKAKIIFKDGSELNLGHESEVKITEFHYNPADKLQQSVFQAARGIMRAKVGKLKNPKSRFEIKTATAICGVLGTEYVVEIVMGSPVVKLTKATSLSDSVAVKSADPAIAGQTTIGPRQAVEVYAGKGPGPAMAVSPAAIAALIEQTTILRGIGGFWGAASPGTKAAVVGGGAAAAGTGVSVPIIASEARKSRRRKHKRKKRHREYIYEQQKPQPASPDDPHGYNP